MAEQEIKFILSATGAEATQAHLNKTGKTADAMGKSVNKSSALGIAGMRGFEVVAADAGRTIGISGEAASVFGRVMGSVTRGIGSASLVLGAVSIAVYGAYLAWKKLSGATSENTKETLKAADAAMQWVESARVETRETDLMREAKEKLFAVNKKESALDLKKGIKEQEAAVTKLYDKMKREEDLYRYGRHDPFSWFSEEQLEESFERAVIAYEKGVAKLVELRAAQEDLVGGNVARKLPKDAADEEKARLQALFDAKVEAANREWEFDQRIAEGKRAFDQAQFDETKRLREEEMKLDLQTRQNKAVMMGGISQIMGQMYELSKQKMKAFFLASRAAAASEAFINYELAAAKAVGQTGLLGIPMAGFFHTMAGVVPALIMAQAYESMQGGGSAPAATPTFNANPATGLPSGPQQQPMQFTLIVNGEERQVGEITDDIVTELWRRGGTAGGISVSMRKTA